MQRPVGQSILGVLRKTNTFSNEFVSTNSSNHDHDASEQPLLSHDEEESQSINIPEPIHYDKGAPTVELLGRGTYRERIRFYLDRSSIGRW
jgi:hypothetical protein